MQLTAKEPEKKLIYILPKRSGRDNSGQVSVRHQGGRRKRFYRMIDFRRNKDGIAARVDAIEYDPNRNCNIALLIYADGEKRYILAPDKVVAGDVLHTGKNAEIKPGNTLPLHLIPVGTAVHNLELIPGRGAKVVRSAGSVAVVLAKEGEMVQVRFPSGEIRRFMGNCKATIGQLGNVEWRHKKLGTAGRARRMGLRPEVRGTAQNPRTHPHGGGEGRSGVGMVSPKSPWGKRTLGKRTRKRKKYSNKFIVARRKK